MRDEPFPLDTEAIRELARLLEEAGLTEIEVEDAGRKLRVVRSHATATTFPAPQGAMHAPESGARDNRDDPHESVHQGAVHSPMVGTAYLAPEPGAPPFVKVGDPVEEGDTLLVIEAMKVMNSIRAQRSGTVTQVLATDGRPVEYGQILMIIE